MTAWSASMVPRLFSTTRMRGPPNGAGSHIETGQFGLVQPGKPPLTSARSRMVGPAPTESTTDALGL